MNSAWVEMDDQVILICGSRTYTDECYIRGRLDNLREALEGEFQDSCVTTVIHGGAIGADKLGGEWAEYRRINEVVVKPDWQRYGRSAGFKRNLEMLDMEPTLVVAFWDGESKGTLHTITQATLRGIPVVIYGPDPAG